MNEEDIIIKCKEKNNNNKIKFKFIDKYQNTLIKSGNGFNKDELFKINNTIIEGIYIKQKDNKNNKYIQISEYYNCKKNGYHYIYFIKKGFKQIYNYTTTTTYDLKIFFILLKEKSLLINKIYYKDDKINGLYESWYQNGRKYFVSYRINDKFNGLTKKYYKNGMLESVINYKDGLKQGMSEHFYRNGNKKSCQYYNNDKLIDS
jgi:antitoxin component YwqK of YwqJK toxin-antitoxin module